MAEKEEAAEKSEKSEEARSETPALEWVFAFIGLILVVGVIGFLIYKIIEDKGNPPNLSLKTYDTVSSGQGYLVKFGIENSGDETAADVTIEGELKKNGETKESADVTIDYVPSHSEKKGGLFFTENPAEYELRLRAKGYNEP